VPTETIPQEKDTRRSRLESLRAQLENERSSFTAHWRDLSDFILPRRTRFFLADVNKGDRRSQKIIDSTATLAARTLRAGMMGGITSPARPWFRLSTPDPDLADVGAVKGWLDAVSTRMRSIFLRSNLYNALPLVYGDLGVFGSAAMFVEEDLEDGIRCYVFPVGSYMIANDAKLKVKVFHREFRMTVRQVVEMFGRDQMGKEINWTNISTLVKSLWDQGLKESWIDVAHVIMPNPDFDPSMIDSKYKRFYSAYYERGGSSTQQSNYMADEQGKMLREAGFDFFPVLAPRWEVSGEDVYGTSCPGMDSLGDIRQLQLGEKRGAQAIEKMVNPPMVAPTALRTVRTSLLPGDITYSDEREGQKGFRPAHEVNFNLQQHEVKQDQVRQRVRRAFFEDLFLMLASSDRRQITAREVEERHEEKLLALGPVLEQLNQDLLDPLIDITFDIMLRQGLIPEPPAELEGVTLRVEYVSIMAQAQKLVGVSGLERFAGFVGNLAAQTGNPAVLDKVDTDQLIDVYADTLSVPSEVVRSDEDVEAMRGSRQAAAAQQQQAETINEAAGAAQKLAGASLEDDNALKRLLDVAQAGQAIPGA
jgi:hypothetical protein